MAKSQGSGFPKIKIFHIPTGILGCILQNPVKLPGNSPESKDLGGYSHFPRRYLHVLSVQGGPAVVDHGRLVGVEEGADLAEESGLGDQDIQS